MTLIDTAGIRRRGRIDPGIERYSVIRTLRAIQRAARRNGMIYHMGGAEALLHALALVAMRGRGLLARYDWLYEWKPT